MQSAHLVAWYRLEAVLATNSLFWNLIPSLFLFGVCLGVVGVLCSKQNKLVVWGMSVRNFISITTEIFIVTQTTPTYHHYDHHG